MPVIDLRGATRLVAVAVSTLAAATALVEMLQDGLGVPNVSSVYLIAVVVTALVSGTAGAIATAIGSFLLYDFLFTPPRFTLTIAQPGELVSVVVLLFVGVVVGQLAALQQSRTALAETREREARAQFQLSRSLATRSSTRSVLPDLLRTLADQTAMSRIWVSLGGDDASERVAADTSAGAPPARPGIALVLRRTPGDVPAEWIRIHDPDVGRRQSIAAREGVAFRVRIEADGRTYGSIWAIRPRRASPPDRTETRLLSAAADLIGLALAQDRLAAASKAAEIAQASDALKSALLQSVSHDLRTPLATIQAAAGSLRPDSGLSAGERTESSAAIEREVEYLNRLVTNLLDLSRVEGGALRAEREAFELEDLLAPAIDRIRPRLADRPLTVELTARPVLVDPILLDAAVANLLDNAIKHTPDGTVIRVAAVERPPATVRLTVEDGGRGVPPEALDRLFEKFYRVPGRGSGSRGGTGIGLAVVRGVSEAMGAQVSARPSELGGLAIDLDLPIAPASAEADRVEVVAAQRAGRAPAGAIEAADTAAR